MSTPLRRTSAISLVVLALLALMLSVRPAGHTAAQAGPIRINEVESNGGTPGDWVEIINTGASPVDVSGYRFLDNDPAHVPYAIPAGTTIPAGGYLVLEEAQFIWGLGGADSAQLFAADGTTVVDSYSWTAHAAGTYSRCPNGTGSFTTTAVSTKGVANDCSGATPTPTPTPTSNPNPSAVRLNEVESNGGVPGDWVEIINTGTTSVNVSGYQFRDNNAMNPAYSIPTGTSIPAGGYLVLEESQFGFGLGGADSAQLFLPDGVTLVDSYSWTAHATTTYGRCPNGTGSFTTTTGPTKGTANDCGSATPTPTPTPTPPASPWPGDAAVAVADGLNVLGGNMSGLTHEASSTNAPGVLWAVKNGPGTLYRLLWNGSIWAPDPNGGWNAGKALRYPDGTGDPDAEGVTFAGGGSAGGLYVATERNNAMSGVSRNSVLLLNPATAGTTLTATREWNLTADLPVVMPNAGIEAITWIPDSYLVTRGFFDESKNRAYNPADYPNHGTGLFFVGLEANGSIYAYALNQTDGSFTRVATIVSGFIGVMALDFDRELNQLWVVCDNGCNGRSATFRINAAGRFAATGVFERPAGMPNLNNEGFAVGAQAECVSNRKPAYWADDGNTDGHALRRGTVPCGDPVPRSCNGVPATIVITQSGITTTGSPGRDVIVGTNGPDVINGLTGDDLICGAGGDDTIDGGFGDDTIYGGDGGDALSGGGGNDALYGDDGDDTLNGEAGNDGLYGEAGDDKLAGGTGNDRLEDAQGMSQTFDGGPGTNTCVGTATAGIGLVAGCQVNTP